MEKLILILIGVLIFSGCANLERCLRKFPPRIVSETEIITEIKYRDTTIIIEIPGETVYDSIPVSIPCPDLPGFDLSKFVLSKEVQFAKARAWLTFSLEAGLQMQMMLEQKEQEIERTIKNAVKEQSTHTIEKTEEITEIPYVPEVYKYSLWFSLIILGYVVFRIFIHSRFK